MFQLYFSGKDCDSSSKWLNTIVLCIEQSQKKWSGQPDLNRLEETDITIRVTAMAVSAHSRLQAQLPMFISPYESNIRHRVRKEDTGQQIAVIEPERIL